MEFIRVFTTENTEDTEDTEKTAKTGENSSVRLVASVGEGIVVRSDESLLPLPVT